jgi:hypothetical protein
MPVRAALVAYRSIAIGCPIWLRGGQRRERIALPCVSLRATGRPENGSAARSPKAPAPTSDPTLLRNVGSKRRKAALRLPPTVGLTARPQSFFARVGPSGASVRRVPDRCPVGVHIARDVVPETNTGGRLGSGRPCPVQSLGLVARPNRDGSCGKTTGVGQLVVLTARPAP